MGIRRELLFFLLVFLPCVARGDIASTNYVDSHVSEVIEQKIESKVDTSPGTVQTLNGDYTVAGSFTVTGAFKVPTPPLPNPDQE